MAHGQTTGDYRGTYRNPVIRPDADPDVLFNFARVQANVHSWMRSKDEGDNWGIGTFANSSSWSALIRDRGGAFTDMPTLNDQGSPDVDLLEAGGMVGDHYYVGWDIQFNAMEFVGGAGPDPPGNTIVFEYWNGAAWVAHTNVSDGTGAHDTDGLVTHDVETDWAQTTVDGQGPFYYTRGRWTGVAGGRTTARQIEQIQNPWHTSDAGVGAGATWYGRLNNVTPDDEVYLAGVTLDSLSTHIVFTTLNLVTGLENGGTGVVDVGDMVDPPSLDTKWGSEVTESTIEGANLSIVRANSGRVTIIYNDDAQGGNGPGDDPDANAGGKMWESDQTSLPYTTFTEMTRPNLDANRRPDRITLFPDDNAVDLNDIIAIAHPDITTENLHVRRFDRSGDSWGAADIPPGAPHYGVSENADSMRSSLVFDENGDVWIVHNDRSGQSTYGNDDTSASILGWRWQNELNSWARFPLSGDAILKSTPTFGGIPPFIIGGYCTGLWRSRTSTRMALVYTPDWDFVPPPGWQIEMVESGDDGETWVVGAQISPDAHAQQSAFMVVPSTPNAPEKVSVSAKEQSASHDHVVFPPVEAVVEVPPPGPTPTPPVTSAVSLLCQHLYEFEELIDPAGNSFNLTEGIRRHMLREDGYGMPPIRYITQRAPFQHGETLIDFQLEPRIIQKVLRANAYSRDDWWRMRNFLMDILRPNRQVSPGQPVQALIYRQHISDGGHRDLHVMVDASPTMPQRQRPGWDEWSVQDIIRLIAHDPVWFDPTEVVVLLTEEENQLTFSNGAFVGGADFEPGERIYFGGGLSGSVNYIGTWEAFPVIVLTGPILNPTISNDATQRRIALTYDVATGEQITFDLTPGVKTVISGTAGSLTGSLDPTGDLADFSIVPAPTALGGLNEIRLTGADIDTVQGTGLRITYKTRYIGI